MHAQVLEMGIIVHSVVIGLGMGASQNVCTIRPLVTAMCFHQLSEGMGLGGCILQAKYVARMKAGLVFFFSTTTPFGIALELALTKMYRENSPTTLIVVGLFVYPIVKKGLPKKIREVTDCYFLPRRSWPSALTLYCRKHRLGLHTC